LRDNSRSAGSVQDEVPTVDATLVIILLPATLDLSAGRETRAEGDTSERGGKARRWLRPWR
jgi:hypothetical protein